MNVHPGFLVLQVFNLSLLIGWPVLSLVALFGLRQRSLPATAQAIWVWIILVVPLFGAISFWIIKPGTD